jgi:hypothetical protein
MFSIESVGSEHRFNGGDQIEFQIMSTKINPKLKSLGLFIYHSLLNRKIHSTRLLLKRYPDHPVYSRKRCKAIGL